MGWIKNLKKKTKPKDVVEKERRQKESEETERITKEVIDKYGILMDEMKQVKTELAQNRIDLDFSFTTGYECTLSKKEKSFKLSCDPEERQIYLVSPAGQDTIIYNRSQGFFALLRDQHKEVNFDDLMEKHVESLLK